MTRRNLSAIAAIFLVSLVAAACSSGPVLYELEQQPSMVMEVTTDSLTESGLIDARNTCDGVDLSPPLAWTGVPEGTQSFALMVDDIDADEGIFSHWVVVGMPPETVALDEGSVPKGAVVGMNDFKTLGYRGPCLLSGSQNKEKDAHTYVFTVYALDTTLNLQTGFANSPFRRGGSSVDRNTLLAAIDGHILGAGAFSADYSSTNAP